MVNTASPAATHSAVDCMSDSGVVGCPGSAKVAKAAKDSVTDCSCSAI